MPKWVPILLLGLGLLTFTDYLIHRWRIRKATTKVMNAAADVVRRDEAWKRQQRSLQHDDKTGEFYYRQTDGDVDRNN